MSIPIQLVFSDGQTNTLHLRAGTKLLEGARACGVSLLVDCEQGNCGTCQAQVSRGTVAMDEFSSAVLTKAERVGGVVLMCRARATEPAVIELPYTAADALATSEAGCAATVEGIESVAEATIALTLETEEALAFLPGQYVNIAPNGDFHRSFSMANPPGSRRLRFFIALRPDGRFSSWLGSQARVGDGVDLSAPRGTFYLRGDARPKVLVAGGTGLAPFLSMLEQIAQDDRAGARAVSIVLLIGARHDGYLFEQKRLEYLKSELPGLQVHVSCDETSAGSRYDRGRVTELLNGMSIDRSSSIYACGPPPMVEAVRSVSRSKQVPPRQFYAEKFSG